MKSFMKNFGYGNIEVINDGSLTEGDINVLHDHIPGVNISDSSMIDTLNCPSYISWKRLFRAQQLAESSYVIQLDSDTLSLGPLVDVHNHVQSNTGFLTGSKRWNGPVDVEFLDGGALGLNLLPWVEEASHLLVLDAINSRFSLPGQVMELEKDAIPLYRDIKMSDHQITFQEVLGLAKFRGYFPEHLHMVGIHPVSIEIGLGMTPEVEALMPEILTRAERILNEWGLLVD